jgi:hypothetical protein
VARPGLRLALNRFLSRFRPDISEAVWIRPIPPLKIDFKFARALYHIASGGGKQRHRIYQLLSH